MADISSEKMDLKVLEPENGVPGVLYVKPRHDLMFLTELESNFRGTTFVEVVRRKNSKHILKPCFRKDHPDKRLEVKFQVNAEQNTWVEVEKHVVDPPCFKFPSTARFKIVSTCWSSCYAPQVVLKITIKDEDGSVIMRRVFDFKIMENASTEEKRAVDGVTGLKEPAKRKRDEPAGTTPEVPPVKLHVMPSLTIKLKDLITGAIPNTPDGAQKRAEILQMIDDIVTHNSTVAGVPSTSLAAISSNVPPPPVLGAADSENTIFKKVAMDRFKPQLVQAETTEPTAADTQFLPLFRINTDQHNDNCATVSLVVGEQPTLQPTPGSDVQQSGLRREDVDSLDTNGVAPPARLGQPSNYGRIEGISSTSTTPVLSTLRNDVSLNAYSQTSNTSECEVNKAHYTTSSTLSNTSLDKGAPNDLQQGPIGEALQGENGDEQDIQSEAYSHDNIHLASLDAGDQNAANLGEGSVTPTNSYSELVVSGQTNVPEDPNNETPYSHKNVSTFSPSNVTHEVQNVLEPSFDPKDFDIYLDSSTEDPYKLKPILDDLYATLHTSSTDIIDAQQ